MFCSVGSEQVNMVGINHRKLFFFQKVNFARVAQKRGNVAGQKVFAFSKADNKRAFLARRDDSVRIVLTQNDKAV